MERNKIGAAIQYFRESYNISQAKLCKGLCSIATLSRIESGDRDVDSLLLETLLERLGKTPNMFELILTDLDYELYQKREELKYQIQERNNVRVSELLQEYENSSVTKGIVHRQFIIYCRALLNEISNGSILKTIELLQASIVCTIPDFETSIIEDYFLSHSEIEILINIIQHMIEAGMIDRAKVILEQVLKYYENQITVDDNDRRFIKAITIACKLHLQEGDLIKALDLCNRGLEKNKGSRKIDQRAELTYLKSLIMEGIYKDKLIKGISHEDCVKQYLQAYYLYDFLEEFGTAEYIKKHLWEEYQWEDID